MFTLCQLFVCIRQLFVLFFFQLFVYFFFRQDTVNQANPNHPEEWTVGLDYYVSLTGRLVRSLQGKFPFPFMDWRFNEFPNEGAHALYSTCVEIMGLGILDPAQVGAKLVDVILDGCHLVDVQVLPDWINAVGLILSYLPDSYLDGLKKRLVSALNSTPLSQWNLPQNPFEMLNFECVNR